MDFCLHWDNNYECRAKIVIYFVFVSEISFRTLTMVPAFSSFGLNTNIVRIVKKNIEAENR